ncbi:uncharacterized protein LOC143527117 [Brachyhypopomus gauderio]|uniref:uncharacterized protein LOC143527117 n=1 Tax=Brachyhypopomus gauderio TaxID=698409 RepID=UPI004042F7F6
MASMREVGVVLSANTFEDTKKRKSAKKKSKKSKKEKLDKDRLLTKYQKCLKDDSGCESNIFTQIPVTKKRKEKKKKNLKLTEDLQLLLTQHKKLQSPKRHRQPKDRCHSVDIHKLEFAVQQASIKQEPMQPTVGKYHKSLTSEVNVRKKKRVIFNLFPEEMNPKCQTWQNSLSVPDAVKAQSSRDKLPCFYPVCAGSESRSKPPFEGNGVESQSTAEDINSQDLFITQKSISDPYVDISCSASTNDDAAVPAYQHNMSCRSLPPEKLSCKQTAEASTQTENFFTAVVATSFRLHNQNKGSVCTEEALDLSLRNRSRQEHGLHQYNSKPAKDLGHPEIKIADVTSSKGRGGSAQAKITFNEAHS